MTHASSPTGARTSVPAGVPKLATGIAGFDLIADGGLPRARATLIAGTAGSAKTVFATQFLASGIVEQEESGVFVTFEDGVDDIRRNTLGFGWRIAEWEKAGKWAFVDATPLGTGETPVVGAYDLSALLARIEHAADKVKATRVALDSLNALYVQYDEHAVLRSEIYRITTRLKERGLTVVFTGERTEDYGAITMHGIEEFVADNVVILRNLLEFERRRRTVEILKFRGASHQRGEFPFTITSGEGIIVIPLTQAELTQASSTVRVGSGLAELDAMCGGGIFRDSILLVSGATGTGKTLLATHFLAEAAERGERSLLFAFEESRDQLNRNAAAWGHDFEKLEAEGKLRIVNRYPHALTLEDHFVEMRREIEDFRPSRVAVDSLSAVERVAPIRGFREFVIALTSFLKREEVTGMFTSTTASLLGGGSVTEKHISTLTDSIILLRYVESYGRMRRSLVLLKMRGSAHDNDIREYTIDGEGMHIGAPFRDVSGILSGQVVMGRAGEDVAADGEADEE